MAPFSIRRRTNRVLAAVAAALLAAAAFVLAGPATTAQAAPINVNGCIVDDTVVTVAVESDDLAPYEGQWYALHDAFGDPINHAAPVGDYNGVPPLCVVPISGGLPVEADARWAWCLQVFNHVCAEAPLESEPGYDTVITPDEAALIAWRVNEFELAGDTTTDAMLQTQFNIWCISDDYDYPMPIIWWGAPGSVTDCAGYRAWLEAEVLTTLATADDEITLTSSGFAVQPGAVHEIVLTSSIAVVDLSVTGGTLELCPGETGATLVGSTLTLTTPGTSVELCATRDSVGAISITASSATIRPVPATLITSSLPSFDVGPCQLLLTDTDELPLLAAAASIEFAEAGGSILATTGPSREWMIAAGFGVCLVLLGALGVVMRARGARAER